MEQAIDTSLGLRAAVGRVRAVLADDPGLVASASSTKEELRARRFKALLAVNLGAGSRIEQEVVVAVGLPVSTADAVVLPVRWEPIGHRQLLPTFAGELVATSGRPGARLTLRGTYRVPLGLVGRIGDAAGGRRLARKVLTGYLAAVGERVEDEVARRASSPLPVRGPASVDRALGSDYFIG